MCERRSIEGYLLTELGICLSMTPAALIPRLSLPTYVEGVWHLHVTEGTELTINKCNYRAYYTTILSLVRGMHVDGHYITVSVLVHRHMYSGRK